MNSQTLKRALLVLAIFVPLVLIGRLEAVEIVLLVVGLLFSLIPEIGMTVIDPRLEHTLMIAFGC